MKKVLFICKQRGNGYGISYGLVNSCKFLVNLFNQSGIESKVVSVVDNNSIDREVHNYKPTHVFIEALWVVPDKFHTLLTKYKDIKWSVRLHSQIPFIAHEGIAFEWLNRYNELAQRYTNFCLSANNINMVNHLNAIFKDKHISSFGTAGTSGSGKGKSLVHYLPNVYFPDEYDMGEGKQWKPEKTVNIGCFGSIRPLKNHLYQAVASIIFANSLDKKLKFHINGDRVEQSGESILKNLNYLFKNSPHELVCHPWSNHYDFIKVVREMDICLQLSFSETFNIVAADAVWNRIPVVGSKDIDWLDEIFKSEPTDDLSVLAKMKIAYFGREINLQDKNKKSLISYNKVSYDVWAKFLNLVYI